MSVRVPPDTVIRRVLPELRVFIHQLSNLPIPRGTYLTSWYRDAAVNRAVGGAAFSQHRLGLALDLGVPELGRAQLVARARSLGLVAIDEGTHVHIQSTTAGALPRSLFM